MARNWTNAQKAAMAAEGRTLLISAAAGSGKTATLTERIIRRLTDSERPADLSRILIVTFTRAAAAELRERIASALSNAIAADPGNRHLQKQLLGMGSAHISTIDAFCREPVKTQFAALGLPATTRIADDAELTPLKESVLGEIIDEFYLKYAANPDGEGFSLLEMNPFADLCDGLTASKNDEALIPTLLELYDRLLSFPEELERLRMESESLSACARGDFFLSDHGRILAEWLGDFTESAVKRLENALAVISDDPAAVKAYYEPVAKDLEFCRALRAADTYRAAYELFALYQNQRMGVYRGAPEEIAAAKEERSAVVDDIKALKKAYFVDSPEEVARQMEETAQSCRILYDLLKEYDARILEEKCNRGITDFTDNRRFLLKLLRNPDGSATPFARTFAERFDEVYIDEYQDVDEMQDEIFRIVGGNHRFMVGDIKQSIYGFRGADPSVFAGYRRDLTQMTETEDGAFVGEDPRGNSIFMSSNFRCDENIIHVTNRICGKVFRACPQSIGYRSGDDLGFSKPKPTDDYRSPAVQVALLTPSARRKEETEADSEETMAGVEAEAAFVANEIASLLRDGATLANGKPVKPGDIVILMRSLTAMPTFIKALTEMGIPTGSDEQDALDAGKDLLHGSDMTYLVNLLRVIDNPDQDIPLSEVLRAPFPGLDLEDLLILRSFADTKALTASLYGNLEAYAEGEGADPVLREKLVAFRNWLKEYRRLAASRSADGVLRLLRRDERCASRDTSAFLYLYEAARNCKTSTFVSLYTFLKYFEKRIADGVSIAPEGGNRNRVSIMTIHKSKGLEFPVCFLARCGQYFSSRSQSKDLIFEKRGGAAMKLYRRRNPDGTACHAKVDTTLRAVAGLSVKLIEREEEIRLLYVAMTRARERLYLVGTGSDKPVSFGTGDRFATLSCNSYLKWIRGGLSGDEVEEGLCVLRCIPSDEVVPDKPIDWKEQAEISSVSEEWASHYAAVLRAYTPPTALESAVRRVPTKLAASKMQGNLLDACVFYQTDLPGESDGKPASSGEDSYCDAQKLESIRHALSLMASADRQEFDLLLDVSRRPTAAERGTATHLFLQYCRYDAVLSLGIEEEIARLVEEGFMDERSGAVLDRKMLEGFFASDFFRRMQGAVRLERELKFSRFVSLRTLTANAELAEALGDRMLFVQGSVDLIGFFEDGSIVICDYKTDRITAEERQDVPCLRERMIRTHGEQMKQYAAAVAEMFGTERIRVFVFSLALGEAMEIPLV